MKVITLFKNEKVQIEKAAAGNSEAQKSIYNQYSAKMLSVCRYYIRDMQEAEDVMITAFFKVFTSLKSFKHEGSFEGWIRRIMVRESLTFLRRKKDVVFFDDETFSHKHEPTEEIHLNLDVHQMQQCIDAMPDGYKAVFVMFAIEGYSHKEIAQALKISENTSKSQLFKARKLLQTEITKLNAKRYESR
ncbi:RNA polymerase sigma factor [Zhouia sp. PK063]|uniref:RNA polymerase sigma factor n=1 Tax=Zhouia sp. PK063 TaxID=3373602 RepID=UPI0037ADBB28